MSAKWMVVLLGAVSALTPAAARAQGAPPMFVTNLTGSLHIQQATPSPCNGVDMTTPVVAGRLEISPAEGLDYGALKYFVLSSGSVSFAPFSVHVSCLAGAVSHTRNYTNVAVQLGQAADFVGFPSSTPGAFEATIPRQRMLFYQATLVNGDLETGYKRPKEDVTGRIDLVQGTVEMQVVVGTKIHVEWPSGCADNILVPCIFDEDQDGTLTATLTGTLVFPDTDGDGIPDRNDNCPRVANRDQARVPPLIQVPPAVTVASCAERRFGPAIGIDICFDVAATVFSDAPEVFRPGANAVSWTAVDAQGHSSTRRQTVTVMDATPPVFTSLPGDVDRANCGPVALGWPTVEDDCGGRPTLGNDAPPSFPPGETTVTWTATDPFGNRAAAMQTVRVTDTVAPKATCVPASAPADAFRVSASDACGAPTIRLGGFVLGNGETVLITEGGGPGVRLVGYVGRDRLRHFEVGQGEGVITAADAAGLAASARCR